MKKLSHKEKLMKRDKDNAKKPKWIKLTEGTLILREPREMRLKYKEVFRATVQELGKWVDDFELLKDGEGKFKVDKKLFKAASKKEQKKEVEETPPAESDDYTMTHKGGGFYDIFNAAGEQMNEKPLKKKKAKLLLDELNSVDTGSGDE